MISDLAKPNPCGISRAAGGLRAGQGNATYLL
jgi:hypothetical protein